MTIIRASVFHVLETFPDRGEDIKHLFKRSPEFQSMCEDYRQCAEALRHWDRSNDKNAPVRRREYALLRQELMDEIGGYLNNSI